MAEPAVRNASAQMTVALMSRFVLRSTGFSLDWLDELRFPRSERHADLLAAARDTLRALHDQFDAEAFGAACAELTASGADRAAFKFCYRLRRDIGRWLPIGAERRETARRLHLPELALWLRRWDGACSDAAQLAETGRAVFAEELAERRAALARIAADPRFREALWLSNPEMHDVGLTWFAAHWDADRRPAKIKHLERRCYAYLQRLCAKNDTVSFFGPLDYGRVAGSDAVYRRGAEPLRRRHVFVAYWAVAALAAAIAAEPEFRPQLRPRRDPLRPRPPAVAGPLDHAVHLRCDGDRTAADIAAELGTTPAAVLAAVDRLAAAGRVHVEPALPASSLDPISNLRMAVSGMLAGASRDYWLAEIAAVEAAAARFADAPLEARRRLLADTEARLEALTGARAPRGDGRMFTDRTVFYEECLGPVEELRLTDQHGAMIAAALQPILQLCAVFAERRAEAWRAEARSLLRELGADHTAVSLPRFLVAWRRAHSGPVPTPAADRLIECLAELVSAAQGPVCRLDPADVASLAGLPARPAVASPDIMLAAPDFAAIARGEFQVVLGELHHGVQPVGWMLTFADDSRGWEEEVARYLPPAGNAQPANLIFGRRMKTAPPEFPGPCVRASGSARGDCLALTDLTVGLEGEEPALRAPGCGKPLRFYAPSHGLPDSYEPFACFSQPILAAPTISLGRHTPRIEIGAAVFQRERWEIAADELAPGGREDSFALFAAAAAVRRRHGIPARVFVRARSEPKPVYIDFANYFAVELLAHLAGANDVLTIEEMWPSPGGLWLRGPGGRLCGELRMVASTGAQGQ